MKLLKSVLSIAVFIFFMFFLIQCEREIFTPNDPSLQSLETKAKPTGDAETVGNNLSYPVIWADDETKALNGNMGVRDVTGEWWYVWGEDPIDPAAAEEGIPSCQPDPDNMLLCDDGVAGTANGDTPGDGGLVYKAWVQKDAKNLWQASNLIPGEPYDLEPGTPLFPDEEVYVDWVDWGDNLESIDWRLKSQVRTEIVLYKDLDYPAIEYAMRHVESWGIDEVHGQQENLDGTPVMGDGWKATVFSPNARFTIQKLEVGSLDDLAGLTWVPRDGWTDDNNLVGETLFNEAVYEAEDGPGFYNAEVNVKGKVIYGYTWNVREMNDGEGYYRLTFSFDNELFLNTYFNEFTEILLPIEEEEVVAKADDSGEEARGGTAVMYPLPDGTGNYITYMDVLIVENSSGGGGQGTGGGSGGNGKGKK